MTLETAIKKYKKKAAKFEAAWDWEESHIGIDADQRNLKKMKEYDQLVKWLEELLTYKTKSQEGGKQ